MTKITFDIQQFSCLNDNYGYLVHEPLSGETAAIDTPDAGKYLEEAEKLGWTITHILNTHWHPDHAGGNLKIKEATGCTIYGPAGEAEKIPGIDVRLKEGDTVEFGRATARVLDVPGHTLGHIAYYFAEQDKAFVGDALFALGCGRVFEGTMEMMWTSLSHLKALPPQTQIYCAHEYTQANARFAETIETGNADLADYVKWIDERRAKGLPTVPTRMAKELATNPFLRADVPELQAAMGRPGDAVATFAEIRGRKDSF
jgi:hydroxyacylglutathione hydrolase